MKKQNQLEQFERRVEECMTVAKRLAFTMFETAMFFVGLYTIIRTIFRQGGH